MNGRKLRLFLIGYQQSKPIARQYLLGTDQNDANDVLFLSPRKDQLVDLRHRPHGRQMTGNTLRHAIEGARHRFELITARHLHGMVIDIFRDAADTIHDLVQRRHLLTYLPNTQ